MQSEPYVSISGSANSSCAVGRSGRVYCWGANDFGQLGDGSTKSSSTPIPIKSDQRFSSVSIGFHGGCGLTVNGKIHCWGRNSLGLMGDCKSRNPLDWPRSPEQICVNETFVSVSTGDDFACAVSTKGDVWCWGASWGNGDPDKLSTSTPFIVRRAAGVIQLAAGHLGTCALGRSEIDCWGTWTLNQSSDFRPGILGIFESQGLGCTWTSIEMLCAEGFPSYGECGGKVKAFSCFKRFRFSLTVKKVSGFCALSETGIIECWDGAGRQTSWFG